MSWITNPLKNKSFEVNAKEYMSQDGMKLKNTLRNKRTFTFFPMMNGKLTGTTDSIAPVQKIRFSLYDK